MKTGRSLRELFSRLREGALQRVSEKYRTDSDVVRTVESVHSAEAATGDDRRVASEGRRLRPVQGCFVVRVDFIAFEQPSGALGRKLSRLVQTIPRVINDGLLENRKRNRHPHESSGLVRFWYFHL